MPKSKATKSREKPQEELGMQRMRKAKAKKPRSQEAKKPRRQRNQKRKNIFLHIHFRKWKRALQSKPGATQQTNLHNVTIIPKAELKDQQVKDLYHGELVIPPGELALK